TMLQDLDETVIDVDKALQKVGLETVELQIDKAEYGAGEKQHDVTAILAKQVGKLPLLRVPGRNYNSAFGDPAPNERKSLKIKYRINGKAAEATFAENSMIVLPMP
ncbi:MAG: DUF3395 domain-containing protein, partial [Planctomycetales bacterium]|nr:DUF3395 domain-containing protein [Planctomycetales bacterium]